MLRGQAPLAFWTSPPLGCLFLLCPALPCAQPQLPTPRLVAVLRRAVLLYSAGALTGTGLALSLALTLTLALTLPLALTLTLALTLLLFSAAARSVS